MSGDVLSRLEAVTTQATLDGHHRVPSELLVGAVLALRSAREQTALHVGRCGATRRMPQVLLCCELPAGHAGWHRDDRGADFQPDDPPTPAVGLHPDHDAERCAACAMWLAAHR